MLGCNDFCGYYEWTFHYLRRRFGEAALQKYWANAIAADAQQHYMEAARNRGLRGLYDSWLKTGDDEQCDWTVTFDEAHNLLRLDMRQCPSKGFLLDNDLNADEDYCDHCMGWIAPALQRVGAEVAAHEHNHCGQCWWEIRSIAEGQPPVQVSADIRNDPRWGRGYLHRYAHHEKLPICRESGHVDSSDLLTGWFRDARCLAVVGPDRSAEESRFDSEQSEVAVIVSGCRYAAGDYSQAPIRGVMLEHDPAMLRAVAERWRDAENRPLLMHPYFPSEPMLDFAAHGLPRAVPILPLLIRTNMYAHRPQGRHPSAWVLAVLLGAALEKQITLRDIQGQESRVAPHDIDHLRPAWPRVAGRIDAPQSLQAAVRGGE